MSARQTTSEFLNIADSHEGISVMPVAGHVLGGASDSLFGGVGVAAGLIALEHLTNRPAVFMTCQFASTISAPAELVLSTKVVANGKSVSQGRITASHGDRLILNLLGATGRRTEDHRSDWHQMPDAIPPEECEPLERLFDTATLHQHVDVRMARGMFGFAPEGAAGRGEPSGDNSTLIWTRMPKVVHDAAALAILADYLPSAVGNALSARLFCSSLDNTIRFAQPIVADETSEWVLCESHVEFVGAGFASNRGFLWSRDGRLLATANQSVTVSTPRPE